MFRRHPRVRERAALACRNSAKELDSARATTRKPLLSFLLSGLFLLRCEPRSALWAPPRLLLTTLLFDPSAQHAANFFQTCGGEFV